MAAKNSAVIDLCGDSDDEAAAPSKKPAADPRGEAVFPKARLPFADLAADPGRRVLMCSAGDPKRPGKLAARVAPSVQKTLTSFFGGAPEALAPPETPTGVPTDATGRIVKLLSGCVLIRAFLGPAECDAVVAAADAVSRARPFTIPPVHGYLPGAEAFSHIYTTYAGMVWNGRATPTRYEKVEGTPDVLDAFRSIAARACGAALAAFPYSFPAVTGRARRWRI